MTRRREDPDHEEAPEHGAGGEENDLRSLPPRWRRRLERLVPRLLELGMGHVCSAEHEGDGRCDSIVDCEQRLPVCRALCCSFLFALTPDEVAGDRIRWNFEKPYFIARGRNGYCTHHDSVTGRCGIWESRPLRCRRYDCRRERNSPWSDERSLQLKPGAFSHLPPASAPREPVKGTTPGRRGEERRRP